MKLSYTKPDYKIWSREKLEKQFFALRLEHAVCGIHKADEKYHTEKVEKFIEALKDLLEDDS